MKRQLIPLLSATVLGLSSLAVAGTADAGEGGRPITVQMTGAAERPDPGDPDGSGIATFRINPGQERICFTLTVEDIEPAAAAHIHVAPATDPGPVVVPLVAPTDGTSSGCVEVDRALARAIIKNPEAYYVNVHNADFPGGAVRGQLG
jgi:hypothetical protein